MNFWLGYAVGCTVGLASGLIVTGWKALNNEYKILDLLARIKIEVAMLRQQVYELSEGDEDEV